MEGILKVSPEQLTATANEFSTIGTTVRNLTTSMTETVTGLSAIWEGEAASAYVGKFNGLQNDIERLNAMVQEHSKDLIEMAGKYTSAEAANTGSIEGLSSDVIV